MVSSIFIKFHVFRQKKFRIVVYNNKNKSGAFEKKYINLIKILVVPNFMLASLFSNYGLKKRRQDSLNLTIL